MDYEILRSEIGSCVLKVVSAKYRPILSTDVSTDSLVDTRSILGQYSMYRPSIDLVSVECRSTYRPTLSANTWPTLSLVHMIREIMESLAKPKVDADNTNRRNNGVFREELNKYFTNPLHPLI